MDSNLQHQVTIDGENGGWGRAQNEVHCNPRIKMPKKKHGNIQGYKKQTFKKTKQINKQQRGVLITHSPVDEYESRWSVFEGGHHGREVRQSLIIWVVLFLAVL